MKEQTFIVYIEQEIYKTLEKFVGRDKVIISEFLKELRLEVTCGRPIKFSHSSLFNAILFMKLKRIMSQSKLAKHLRSNRTDAINLGFYLDKAGFLVVPDQRTLSHFIRNILDDEMRNALEVAVQKIEELAKKFGIVFDIQIIAIEPPRQCRTQQALDDRKRRRLNELCRFARRRIYPNIEIDIHHNAKYKKNDILDSCVYLAREQTFAHDGLRRFEAERNQKILDSDTLFYHLKKCDDIKEMQRMFTNEFDLVWSIAKSSGLFDKRSYDVAIDFTDWFYYGKRAPMIVRKKPEKGTSKCYRFATINIVEYGIRFTLLALPVGIFDSKEDIVDKLICYAKTKIKINRIYADRGFFSADVINVFYKHGLTFLMPATQNSRIAKMVKNLSAPSIIKGYEMTDGRVKFNLAVIDDGDGKKAFATNIDVDERESELVVRLFNLYSKRWGIETSYRMKKELRARTTSKNYIIRLFYFLFSTMLYNLWILIDSIISKSLLGRITAKHLVTEKMFATILFIVAGIT